MRPRNIRHIIVGLVVVVLVWWLAAVIVLQVRPSVSGHAVYHNAAGQIVHLHPSRP